MVLLSIKALQKFIGLNEWNKMDLVDNSGVPLGTIQRIMRGNPCRESTAGKLAKALNVDFEDIVEEWNVKRKRAGDLNYFE